MGAQRTVREAWRQHIVGLLDQALERNDAAISDVAAATTTTILVGRHVYAFGAGHSLALVSEMHRRAGSMKTVRPLWNAELTSRIDAEAAGKLDNQAGYYKELTGGLDWGPGDLCWVISNSGRNALVVELALEARRHGVTVVGLVSAAHSATVAAASATRRWTSVGSPSGWDLRPPSSARPWSTPSGPRWASAWRRGGTCPRS